MVGLSECGFMRNWACTLASGHSSSLHVAEDLPSVQKAPALASFLLASGHS